MCNDSCLRKSMICIVLFTFQFGLIALDVQSKSGLEVPKEKQKPLLKSVSSWSAWEHQLRSSLMNMFSSTQANHPEFSQSELDSPCKLTLEITKDGYVGKTHVLRKSSVANFDSEVVTSVYCARNNLSPVFPEGSRDEYVRCSISFFPHGRVSNLEIEHPRKGELFIDRTVRVPVERSRHSSPEVVGY